MDQFDYTRGFRLKTYAARVVNRTITRAIANQKYLIRLPEYVCNITERLQNKTDELRQILWREPTDKELGNALDMPAERVRYILDMTRQPMCLDEPMEEDENSCLRDTIADDSMQSYEEEVSWLTLKKHVKILLRNLSNRERDILILRYGLKDDRPRTLEEVAKAFGITRDRIIQIETRILRKLRFRSSGANKLRSYLD